MSNICISNEKFEKKNPAKNYGLLNHGASSVEKNMSTMSLGWGWLLGIAVGSVCSFSVNSAIAQITPDGTLPNNTIVTPDGSTFNISGGTVAGANLFHSFQEFSVPTNTEVIFNNAVDIQNIISRVTGGSGSNIDGLIRTLGSANLFLINPNGIVFGPNASLNINGSFVASTANAIQFGERGFFSATNPDVSTPLLTINPSALFFNQRAIAAISNSSVTSVEQDPTGTEVTELRVRDGQSLLLVGGDVNLNGGRLRADGGRVELAGIKAPGTVGLNISNNTFSLNIPQNIPWGNVSLSGGARVNVRGSDGGSIAINAQNVNLTERSRLSAGIATGLGTQLSKAGNIIINAKGEINLNDGSSIANEVEENAVGTAGDINITTSVLTLRNGSGLFGDTNGQGDAGNVRIDASNTVSLEESNIFSRVLDDGQGNGGDISINAASVSLFKGGLFINSQGQGSAGNATINASEGVTLNGGVDGSGIFTSVENNGIGNSGNIRITTGTFLLINQAILNTSTNGIGKAGDIQISANSISLTNGANLFTDTQGQGDAGSVTINADKTVNLESSSIFSRVLGNAQGNGGNININTASISLTKGGLFTNNSQGQGDAGSVTINASEDVTLNGGVDGGGIFTLVENNGTGNSGNIRITTKTFSLTNQAILNTSTNGIGNGGDVILEARDNISFNNAYIFNTANPASQGKGGDVQITGGDIAFANGSLIILSTNGQGPAGDAIVTARSVSLTDGSLLTTATTSAGDAGEIRIKATEFVSLSGSYPISGSAGRDGRSTEISSDTLGKATGRGGNIIVETPVFRLSNGAILNVRTTSSGTGGSITVNSKTFEAINGGELISTTSGSASAGKITVNASDRVSINGSDPTVNQRRSVINANPDGFTLPNVEAAGGLFVRSESTGSAGNIEVTTPQILLDNTGTINATSASGNGGDISLAVGDLLLLRRGSQISATAGTAGAGGNGGNITINAPNGFIVSVPNENNDITANAFDGSGGVIRIISSGNFNIQQRDRKQLEEELGTDGLLDPQLLPTNDITAFSQTNPILDGQISISTLDVDQNLGLIELPAVLADTSDIVDTGCTAFADGGGSEFIVTGRGGLPPSPNDPLSTDVVWSDTRLAAITSQQQSPKKPATQLQSKSDVIEINPATGWVFDNKGNVTLISHTSNHVGTTSASCVK
ncbi:MAG: filamentous hemagglutinin N-terminal domain-containing protein [Scytonema sp. PMC 1069.18]|nr:filamentous hemagglutinin N-terminal domain-containing protein [Scytonema sp. PMC 1069.18]MEC4881058.1 filamentous hemagglutinin N-terminal domain-containing protein [Scytonema sp. PMC 1070.18]